MAARHVVLVVTGPDKASILAQALEGSVSSAVPASLLRAHEQLTVLVDADAARALTTYRLMTS